MKRFCPKCGKEAKQLVRGFCKECFLQENEILQVPEVLELEKCKKCGKARVKGKWLEESEQVLKEFVAGRVKGKELSDLKVGVKLEWLSEKEVRAMLAVEGKVNETVLRTVKKVVLKLKSVSCDSCMKLSSNYFESIVQLRFEKKPSEKKVMEKTREAELFLQSLQPVDSLAAISKVRKVGKGLDLLVGSKRAGRKLAEFFARHSKHAVKSSHTVEGLDRHSGKAKKKFTFCVRL